MINLSYFSDLVGLVPSFPVITARWWFKMLGMKAGRVFAGASLDTVWGLSFYKDVALDWRYGSVLPI